MLVGFIDELKPSEAVVLNVVNAIGSIYMFMFWICMVLFIGVFLVGYVANKNTD